MNEHEWQAVLRGQAIPADMLVGETTAAYIVRKIAEATPASTGAEPECGCCGQQIKCDADCDAGNPPAQDEAVSVDDLLSLLPGPYYMDPPDGGNVTVLEQLQRMAKDAERYRYLRDDGNGFDISVREEGDEGEDWVTGYSPDDLDAAIDAALAQRGE